MLESKNIYIVGYSGHAYVAIDIAIKAQYNVKGYFDLEPVKCNPYQLKYFGFEQDVNIKNIVNFDAIFPAIGSNSIRKKAIAFLQANTLRQVNLVDPSANISPLVIMGCSTSVAPLVAINSLVLIGNGCIINTGAIIEHECEIGDYTHIGPGALLAGNVRVGKSVFVGARSVVKQGVSIGDYAIIGAGTVVINDIPRNETWVGNPARRIK